MTQAHPLALVTGGARRIGAAIVRRLHADGYDIALHFRQSLEDAHALAAELNAIRADSVLLLQAELDTAEHATALVADTIAKRGGVLGGVQFGLQQQHAVGADRV